MTKDIIVDQFDYNLRKHTSRDDTGEEYVARWRLSKGRGFMNNNKKKKNPMYLGAEVKSTYSSSKRLQFSSP